MKEITLTINDRKVKGVLGDTVLDVCRANDIDVPTLCHFDGLTDVGGCRMCVVEVEGRKNLVPSCSEPITDQMQVTTHSQRVINSRKTIIELLLADHPDDCLYCDRNNNCELQSLANEYGVDSYNFGHVKESQHEVDNSSFSVIRDMDKCVLCKRCVRKE